MQSYSLQKRLIVYVSIFSVMLGCVLVFAAYRIALEEMNEILDAQMQSLAERIAANHPEPTQSQINLNQRYSEEDLFVDIWSYDRCNTTITPSRCVATTRRKTRVL